MVQCSESFILSWVSFFKRGLIRLYVGSLHFNLTETDIKQVFEPFGELEFVDLHKDPMTGRSKGYAFIQLVFFFIIICALDSKLTFHQI